MPTENLDKKQKYIRFLFSQVAERYDLFNRIASLSLDGRWREKVIFHLQPENGNRFLDVGTGTGELALKLAERTNKVVVGVDFCDKMLDVAKRKKRKRYGENIRFVLAKAEDLPFPDNYFDGIITGFVMRHLKIEEALKEIIRVLRPNGHLVILEISKPESIWFRKLYYFHLRRILPLIGMTLVGTKEPFRVLASSVIGFLEAEELKSVLQKMGLRKIRNCVLNNGIVSLYAGVK